MCPIQEWLSRCMVRSINGEFFFFFNLFCPHIRIRRRFSSNNIWWNLWGPYHYFLYNGFQRHEDFCGDFSTYQYPPTFHTCINGRAIHWLILCPCKISKIWDPIFQGSDHSSYGQNAGVPLPHNLSKTFKNRSRFQIGWLNLKWDPPMRRRKKQDWLFLAMEGRKGVSHPDLSTKLSVIATVHEVGMDHDKINIRDQTNTWWLM